MAAFPREILFDRFSAFIQASPPVGRLTAAAALHTEAGLRSPEDNASPVTNHHLNLAAAIVEVGTPPRIKRLGALDLKKWSLPPVPPLFRRLWFLTVISVMENGGNMSVTEAYLKSARELFPRDPEFLLLSGIAEEMRAANRLVTLSAGYRRKALGDAETYFRASQELAPDRTEAKLRLGRVLWQRDHAAEARPLLIAVSDVPDERLSYLACLFLGGLEDSAGNPAAAAAWYARAAAKMPSAQAAWIGGSELQHRAGKRHDAAASAASGTGADNKIDPWWGYLFGEHWRNAPYLTALRRSARP